jgi:hypothetical protein
MDSELSQLIAKAVYNVHTYIMILLQAHTHTHIF